MQKNKKKKIARISLNARPSVPGCYTLNGSPSFNNNTFNMCTTFNMIFFKLSIRMLLINLHVRGLFILHIGNIILFIGIH